jgi:hypothetical protein
MEATVQTVEQRTAEQVAVEVAVYPARVMYI